MSTYFNSDKYNKDKSHSLNTDHPDQTIVNFAEQVFESLTSFFNTASTPQLEPIKTYELKAEDNSKHRSTVDNTLRRRTNRFQLC